MVGPDPRQKAENLLTGWRPCDTRTSYVQSFHRGRHLVMSQRLAFAAILAFGLVSCGGGGGNSASSSLPNSDPPPLAPSPVVTLTKADVANIVQAAAEAVSLTTMVIAVVDRAGNVLAVWRKPNAPAFATGNFNMPVDTNDLAVGLARTGAFFSNNQAPLTSRTVRFISGIHLPPGVRNQPNADLYGIENTNRGCPLSQELVSAGISPSVSVNGGSGSGIVTGKSDIADSDSSAVNPGGLPIYKGTVVVGGIGVAAVAPDAAEFAAFIGAGVAGFSALPTPLPPPGEVFLGGVALPAIDQTTRPSGVAAGTFEGNYFTTFTPRDGKVAPEFDLVGPHPSANPDPSNGGLSTAEVKQIIDNAEATAEQTRAAIRLPPGQRARMVIAVADLDGTILGLRRMPDATIFSIDVAATKARNMVYFNSESRAAVDLPGVPIETAVTSRTISFGSQPLFPPGIDGSVSGPFFNLFTHDLANPCTQGFQMKNPNQSGIVFFPGSAGLFRNGVLIAGLGVSGDGVDQDDFVTNGGTKGFEAPVNIRADQVVIDGVRLPYFKFPRNPTD
jgi:uncharacterized protein GlcG (DUF336 family)